MTSTQKTTQKIALIGATGFVGSPILAELLNRDHQVTVLARNPAKIAAQAGVTVVAADVLDAAQVAQAVAGHDVVISAYNPGWSEAAIYDLSIAGNKSILAGVKQAGVKRFLSIGGAGSLYVAPGVQLVDTPQFPAEYKQVALAMREVLKLIEAETTLDWTVLTPPIALAPGERSGKYRTGLNDLLPGSGEAPAGISAADMAVALVDELETPRHPQRRFTVAN
jgi:putative NADH-flavin reductase